MASDYQLPTLNPSNAPVSISAATLTPTLSNLNVNKDYDGTTHATLTGGVLGGIVGADAVTPVDVGSFNSPHAAASVNVTASYTLNGNDSGNYTVTQPTGLSGPIHPKAITATAMRRPPGFWAHKLWAWTGMC